MRKIAAGVLVPREAAGEVLLPLGSKVLEVTRGEVVNGGGRMGVCVVLVGVYEGVGREREFSKGKDVGRLGVW